MTRPARSSRRIAHSRRHKLDVINDEARKVVDDFIKRRPDPVTLDRRPPEPDLRINDDAPQQRRRSHGTSLANGPTARRPIAMSPCRAPRPVHRRPNHDLLPAATPRCRKPHRSVDRTAQLLISGEEDRSRDANADRRAYASHLECHTPLRKEVANSFDKGFWPVTSRRRLAVSGSTISRPRGTSAAVTLSYNTSHVAAKCGRGPSAVGILTGTEALRPVRRTAIQSLCNARHLDIASASTYRTPDYSRRVNFLGTTDLTGQLLNFGECSRPPSSAVR
jgi:hypothetical protein